MYRAETNHQAGTRHCLLQRHLPRAKQNILLSSSSCLRVYEESIRVTKSEEQSRNKRSGKDASLSVAATLGSRASTASSSTERSDNTSSGFIVPSEDSTRKIESANSRRGSCQRLPVFKRVAPLPPLIISTRWSRACRTSLLSTLLSDTDRALLSAREEGHVNDQSTETCRGRWCCDPFVGLRQPPMTLRW